MTTSDLPEVLGTAPHVDPPRLRFSLPLEPERLLRARQRIRDYLHDHGADSSAIDDVVLAIQEAMTNAVRHSKSTEDVEVSVWCEGPHLVAAIRDHGVGFDVNAFDPQSCPSLDEPGGRGLYLIAHLMDMLELHSDGGLEVRIVKRNALSAPAAASPEQCGPHERHRASREIELFEEIDEGIFALDWEYRFTFANSALCRLIGIEAEALLGRTLWDVFPRVVGTAPARAQREAMELGIPAQLEYISPTMGRWLELRVYPTASGVLAYSRDIHERKMKELERDEFLAAVMQRDQALFESEEKFRTIADFAFDWEIWLSPEGKLLYSSPSCERITGYTAEEFMANPELLLGVVRPEDRRLLQLQVEHTGTAPAECEGREIEFRIRRKDGEERWLARRCNRVLTADGRDLGVRASNNEIGERKRAEAALRVSQERFLLLHETMLQGVVFQDAAGTIVSMNPAAERILGKGPHEFLGSSSAGEEHYTLREDGSPFPGAEHPSMVALRTGQPVPDTLMQVYNPREGQYRLISIQAVPLIRPGEDKPHGVYTVFDDVTDHRRAEEALRESERRFWLALRNAPISVSVQDLSLRHIWAFNQHSARPEEIIGHTDEEIFTPEEAKRLTEIKRRVIAEDREIRERMWFQRPTGRMYLDVLWEPMHDEAGNVIGVGNVTIDLTPMKLAEEALEQSERRFRTLFESMEEGVALHEVVYDGDQPVDYRILQVNAAYERQSGVDGQRAQGTLASELYGTGEPPYLAEFTHVAETGEAHIMETYFAPLDRHFRISVVSPARGQFATIFQDVTERKRREDQIAELLEAQQSVLQRLQQSFHHRPGTHPSVDVGLTEVAASAPDLVGGDFWDLVEISDGRMLVVIGDVAGKGISAATRTMTVRTAIRAFAHMASRPGFILAKTNELLRRENDQGSGFVTALVAVLDPLTGELELASAGHPAPLRLTAGSTQLLEPVYGPPLGCFEADYITSRHTLSEGDCLVLYTDGVTEARRSGELFGEKRLMAACDGLRALPAQEVADHLRRSAEDFGGALRDDLAVLVLRLRGEG